MPRPKKDDPRDWNFTLRMSVAERSALERRARAAGISLSTHARRRLFGDAAQEVAPSNETPVQRGAAQVRDAAAFALADQVRRAGVNLNQIARHLNEGRGGSPLELQALLEEIRAYVRQAWQLAP